MLAELTTVEDQAWYIHAMSQSMACVLINETPEACLVWQTGETKPVPIGTRMFKEQYEPLFEPGTKAPSYLKVGAVFKPILKGFDNKAEILGVKLGWVAYRDAPTIGQTGFVMRPVSEFLLTWYPEEGGSTAWARIMDEEADL